MYKTTKHVHIHISEDKNGFFGGFLMAGTTYARYGYEINRPNSDITVLEYVVSGAGTIFLPDGKKALVEAGDVFYLPKGLDHRYISNDEYGQWIKAYINFGGDVFNSLMKSLGLGENYIYRGLDLFEDMKKMSETVKEKSPDTEIKCADILFGTVSRLYHSISNRTNENLSDSVVLKRYIDKNYSGETSIGTLAALINKSESQTIRIFKRDFGLTPHRYVLERKLEMAEILLEKSELSIRSIAEKLAFADEFYFSNSFKKRFGIPPSIYREISRGNQQILGSPSP